MRDCSVISASSIAEGLLPSPLGTLKICANTQGITAIEFIDDLTTSTAVEPSVRLANLCQVDTLPTAILPAPPLTTPASALVTLAQQQLAEYFQGQRHHFELPLHFAGTSFQQQVWHALAAIPYGCVCSYQCIAKKVQRPQAMRAVGAANGRNALAIVIPCHRVIGSQGHLTGYAGGLPRKLWLLQHEQRYRSII